MQDENIPLGLCQCGCGQKTNISPCTDRPRGYFKGVPYLYAKGHKSKQLRIPLQDRLWARVDKSGDCWLWMGSTIGNGSGYGSIQQPGGGKSLLVHVVAWELLVGAVPAGKELHHTCSSRACVNPAHLTPLTRAEHHAVHVIMRTHCRRGHAFDRVQERADGRNYQYCSTCARERDRQRRSQKKGASR